MRNVRAQTQRYFRNQSLNSELFEKQQLRRDQYALKWPVETISTSESHVFSCHMHGQTKTYKAHEDIHNDLARLND